MSELRKKIKEQRLLCNYTLAEVAELIGVKEATVHRYESGEIKNIKHDTIVKLADIFKCTPAYLMGWTDNPKETPEDTKKNDTIADIILRLRSDNNYMELCYQLSELPDEKINAVKTILSAFQQQNVYELD